MVLTKNPTRLILNTVSYWNSFHKKTPKIHRILDIISMLFDTHKYLWKMTLISVGTLPETCWLSLGSTRYKYGEKNKTVPFTDITSLETEIDFGSLIQDHILNMISSVLLLDFLGLNLCFNSY